MRSPSIIRILAGVLLLLALWPKEDRRDESRKLSTTDPIPASMPSVERPLTPLSLWVERYAAETPERRLSLLGEGARLANEQVAALKGWIVSDPQRALAAAVPMEVRQQLPPQVEALLEQRINAEGSFGVLGMAAEGNVEGTAIRRIAVIEGQRYQAFVYGRRSAQRTTERMNFVGVAVDGLLAVADAPMRVLETGEVPDPSREAVEVCPVSGRITASAGQAMITVQTPAVEVGRKIYYLCHAGHIQAFADQLVAQEGQTGGASKPTGAIPTSYTTGPKRVLYIRATFPDQLSDPQSERDSYDMMKQVGDFMAENSYGKCYFLPTVTPLIILPHTLDWYNYDNTDGSAFAVLSDGVTAAREAGFDISNFDTYAVRYNGPGGFSGQGYVGGSGVWLKSSSAGVAIHEFGHNLGLWHANYWTNNGKNPISSGSNNEYGHSFDTMGAANGGNYSFNAEHRQELNWLPATQTTAITSSGLYRIYQIDQPILDPARRYALNFRKDAQRTYWGEFRQKWTGIEWMMQGMQMCWAPWGDASSSSTAYGSNRGAQLLDLTPGTPDLKNDAPLTLGKTFADTEASLYCTVVGKGGTTPESLDVQVNFGPYPGNQAPVLVSLTPSLNTPSTGASITLTAVATDADGDTLAYAWSFGDKTVGQNSATVSKSWSVAGNYMVRCEVSDMKGKIAASSVLITVGGGSGLTATGFVYDNASQPLVNVLVNNGLTGSSFRGFYTNSDGAYTVTGLTAGSTLNALLEGFTFAASGANFIGTPLPAVSITALDPTAVEGAGAANETGLIRITRTGSTASSLVVRGQWSGTALIGTDYLLSQTALADLQQYYFTIPAGSATLDLLLTPIDDASLEGPETATFNVIPTTSYVTQGPTSATITIDDTDTALPVVSLLVLDNQAGENGDSAQVAFRRTGSTAAALTVNFTLDAASTATNGSDFPTLPASVTISSGASETIFTLTPTNDTLIEGSETALLQLSTSAAYLRHPTAQSASLQIYDDDLPTVSMAATDATGSETSSDPLVFTVSRTGPTTAALQVEYSLGGTAHHGTDYAPLAGTLTIPTGQASAVINVYPLDDSIGEPAQTVIITLRSEPKYLISTASATGTITDNDLPLVTLDVTDGDCSEASNSGTFRVLTTGTGSGNITVNYTVTGTATSGVDHVAMSGTVSVAKANGSANITLTPIQDALFEDAEFVTITLTANAAYVLAPESNATMAILDDDQPMVQVSTDDVPSLSEGGTGTFYISRLGSTTSALTIDFTWAGNATLNSDFTATTGSVTIPAGSTGVAVTVTALGDAAVEGTETVVFAITPKPGTYGLRTSSATLYVADAQVASLSRTLGFSGTAGSFPETSGLVNIPVTLSSSAPSTVIVEYAVSASVATGGGVDYSFTPGTLTFAPGQTSLMVPITLNDDLFVEGNEIVTLQLRNALGPARLVTQNYTLYITSDDVSPEPFVAFASTSSGVTEGAGVTASIPVTLTRAQLGNVTVDYAVTGGTATLSNDYTGGTGTLTFTPGQTTANLLLPLVNDATYEPAETVTLTLSNLIGATMGANTQHTLTITDDDQSIVTIAATDVDAGEEGPNPGNFTITRTGNTSLALTVALTISGTATNGTDYTSLPSTVAMAAGVTSVSIAVSPVDDAIIDPNETVILALPASTTGGGSGNYLVGNPSSAQITLQDNENAPPSITMITPVGGQARLTSASLGLWLQASVTDDGRPASPGVVSYAWSLVSGPGTATFTTPTATTTGCTFSAAGVYVLRLTASDGLLSSQQNIPVTIEPIPWQTADVGNASSVPGSYTLTSGTYTVNGSGNTLTTGTTTDGHYFVYQPFYGDGEMVVRLASISAGASVSARCGLMARESIASNAAHSLVAMTTNRSNFIYRLTTGGTSAYSTTTIAGSTTPRWLRLVRSGNVLSGFTSLDGTSWLQQGGNQTVSFTDPVLVGFAVSSNTTNSLVTAGFDNFQLLPANRAAFVNAGSDASTPITNALTLAGTASDDGKPSPWVLTWSQVAGPGTASFNDVHASNPQATFSQTGTYTLRLSANDGQAVTYDDLNVTVTPPPTVALTASSTPAAEYGLVSANWTFTRNPVSAAPLTIYFTRTGSAASGSDYVVLPASITIAANAASATLTLTPLADVLSEGTEDVTLTLTPNAGYQLGSPAAATLQILDLPIDAWKTASFGLNANSPLISGNHADPDFDGNDNLTEYALHLLPMQPDAAAIASFQSISEISLFYPRNLAATDITIQPVWSNDLSQWSNLGFTIVPLGSNGQVQQMEATLPLAPADGRKFLKLEISQP